MSDDQVQEVTEQQRAELAEQAFRVAGQLARDILAASAEAQKALEALAVSHVIRETALGQLGRAVMYRVEEVSSARLEPEVVVQFMDDFAHGQSTGGILALSKSLRALRNWADQAAEEMRKAILETKLSNLDAVCQAVPLLCPSASRDERHHAALHGIVLAGEPDVIDDIMDRIASLIWQGPRPWLHFSSRLGRHPVPAIDARTMLPAVWHAAGDDHKAVQEAWAKIFLYQAPPSIFLLDSLNDIRQYPLGPPDPFVAAKENLQTVQRLLSNCQAATVLGLLVRFDELTSKHGLKQTFDHLSRVAYVVHVLSDPDGGYTLRDAKGRAWRLSPKMTVVPNSTSGSPPCTDPSS